MHGVLKILQQLHSKRERVIYNYLKKLIVFETETLKGKYYFVIIQK